MKALIFLLATLYVVPFYLVMPSLLSFGWFVGGVALGMTLLYADEYILHTYYADQTPQGLQLITRSPLFLVLYPFLAVFAVTSAGNMLGIGFVLGIGLILTFEMVTARMNVPLLRQRFFQHLSQTFDDQTVKNMVILQLVVFSALSILAFWRLYG